MPNVKPIPDGYPRVSPHLSIVGAADAIDFYKRVERRAAEVMGGS
jgi:PhnB protein